MTEVPALVGNHHIVDQRITALRIAQQLIS
jgi:hypothetical protein